MRSPLSESEIDAPTGWELLAGKQDRVEIINTLLNMRPDQEFTKRELASFADVGLESVHTHLPLLTELGIVESVPNSSERVYRFNTDSKTTKMLIKLDGAANNAFHEIDKIA